MRAIVPLGGEPRFRPFPFSLPEDAAVTQALRNAERLLSPTPGRFDGPIAFCHGVSVDGTILRRAGRYPEARAVFARPTLAYRLGSSLSLLFFVILPAFSVLCQLSLPLLRLLRL